MFLLNGPSNRDLPEQLREAYVDFTWLPRFTERWTGILGIAPSIYSDLETSVSDAFRLTGTALARYDLFPGRWQLVFGVLYLNRQDITWLPAGGLIWTPTPNVRYEMLFPQPKLSHRIGWGAGLRRLALRGRANLVAIRMRSNDSQMWKIH